MPKMQNRVQETTTTGGTGTITLAGAVTGYITFAAGFTTGDVLFYTIDDGVGAWEIGIGTLVTTGTLSRTTVIASSNSGALVNFSSGTKRVFCSAPTRSLVPDQDSKSGYVLTTDGTNPSWTQTLNSVNIGNTTAGTGAFTTLSASSTVSGTGFSNYLASPPAIGGSSPAAGNFTTLGATGNVTLGDASTDTLTINGTAVSCPNNLNFDSNTLFIDAVNKRVGVGTNVPTATLHVVGTGIVNGPLAIGSAVLVGGNSGCSIRFANNLTGGTNSVGCLGTPQAQADSSVQAIVYSSAPTIAASASITSLIHYNAGQGAFGSGASATNQYGFLVGANLIGATNNFAFWGNIPSGTGRWNFYASGTAANYFAGRVSIGGTPSAPAISLDPTTANALVVNSSGNVGIGTASVNAQAKLEVTGNVCMRDSQAINANSTARLFAGGYTGNLATIFIYAGLQTTNDLRIGGGTSLGEPASTVQFYTGTVGSLGNGSERLRIDSSGTLLLRTTSDGTKNSVSLNSTVENALVLDSSGVLKVAGGTATPAGGSTSARLLFGTTTGFGIYYGSGAPTVSAAQGSIYLRSDGSSTSTRLYINTNGSTTWTNVTTAA